MNKFGFVERFYDLLPRRESNVFLHVTLGIGIGIAAGVGIGLLVAPTSGAETRQKLREGAERAKDRARVAAGRVKGELTAAADRARTEISELAGSTDENRSFASSGMTGSGYGMNQSR